MCSLQWVQSKATERAPYDLPWPGGTRSFYLEQEVTVDYYSNYWELDELTDTTSLAVIDCTKKHFARYGVPDWVITAILLSRIRAFTPILLGSPSFSHILLHLYSFSHILFCSPSFSQVTMCSYLFTPIQICSSLLSQVAIYSYLFSLIHLCSPSFSQVPILSYPINSIMLLIFILSVVIPSVTLFSIHPPSVRFLCVLICSIPSLPLSVVPIISYLFNPILFCLRFQSIPMH